MRCPGRLFLWIAIAGTMASCAGSPAPEDAAELRGIRAAEARGGSRAASEGPRPAALINRQPVEWAQLQPALAEAAGALVLEEIALDRALAAEYRARLNTDPDGVSPARLADERRYLIESIRRTGAAPDGAEDLVRTLRRTRGLGDARFAALLKRSALMRELVAAQVVITPEAVQQRFEVRYGPKYRSRIITTATDAEAADALRELLAGQGDLGARFVAMAARISTDESRTRGGQIEPISPADPAYSPALRAALARLEPGQLTGVLDLQPGYAIALLEEKVPATQADFAEVRPDIEEELRRRQERLFMDSLARRLLLSADVSPLDPALGWSWNNRPQPP
jgi:hypothetical protein